MGLLGSSVVDWQGHEEAYLNLWQKQLHLYEVPFYYIEYGMAQLGAIAMWRSYKMHGESIGQLHGCFTIGLHQINWRAVPVGWH